jgi:hypothetical protein
MKFFGQALEGWAKALVILAAIFLVSCGLCGFSLGVANGGLLSGSRGQWGALLGSIAIGSGIGIVLSALGTAIVAIGWLISAAVRNSRGTQKLFDPGRNKDDEDSR